MELALTIINILSPALSAGAQWLVSLLIKKFGATPELAKAQEAIKAFRGKRAAAKRAAKARAKAKRESGSAAAWLLVILAVGVALMLFLYGMHANADVVTNTTGRANMVPVTIASGQTTSAPIDLGAFSLAGVLIPSAFTGTTMTFYTSNSINGPWSQVYNAAGAVSYTAAPSRYVAMNMADFQGVRYLEIASGSAEAAQRTLNIAIKTSF